MTGKSSPRLIFYCLGDGREQRNDGRAGSFDLDNNQKHRGYEGHDKKIAFNRIALHHVKPQHASLGSVVVSSLYSSYKVPLWRLPLHLLPSSLYFREEREASASSATATFIAALRRALRCQARRNSLGKRTTNEMPFVRFLPLILGDTAHGFLTAL